MAEQTGQQVAAKAGTIMALARKGGPVIANRDEILKALHASTDGDVIERLDAMLRSYFDDAESVAASALTQREQP